MAVAGTHNTQKLTLDNLEKMARENPALLAQLDPNNPAVHKLLEQLYGLRPDLRKALIQTRLVDPNSPTIAADDRYANTPAAQQMRWNAEERHAARQENYVSSLYKGFTSALSTAVSNTRSFISQSWGAVTSWVGNTYQGLIDRGQKLLKSGADFVTKTVPQFFTQTIPNAMRAGWNRYAAPVINAVKPYVAPVVAFVADPVGTISKYGTRLWAQFTQKPGQQAVVRVATAAPKAPAAQVPQHPSLVSLRTPQAQHAGPATEVPKPADIHHPAPAVAGRPNRGSLNVEMARSAQPHAPAHNASAVQTAATHPTAARSRRYQGMAPA